MNDNIYNYAYRCIINKCQPLLISLLNYFCRGFINLMNLRCDRLNRGIDKTSPQKRFAIALVAMLILPFKPCGRSFLRPKSIDVKCREGHNFNVHTQKNGSK